MLRGEKILRVPRFASPALYLLMKGLIVYTHTHTRIP